MPNIPTTTNIGADSTKIILNVNAKKPMIEPEIYRIYDLSFIIPPILVVSLLLIQLKLLHLIKKSAN